MENNFNSGTAFNLQQNLAYSTQHPSTVTVEVDQNANTSHKPIVPVATRGRERLATPEYEAIVEESPPDSTVFENSDSSEMNSSQPEGKV